MPLSSSSSSSSGSSTPSSSRSTTPRPRLAQLPSVRNSYSAQLGSPRSPTSPTAAAAALQGPGTPSLLGRASSYTLHSLAEPEVDAHNVSAESDGTRLLARASGSDSNPRTYGATGTAEPEPAVAVAGAAAGVVPWHQRPLVKAALKVALLFAVSAAVLGGTLWLALPRIKPQDRPLLHIPRNFEDLQGLNTLLKRYRKRSPIRIVICWAATYLFIQAFCVPGSMYLSILGGALWGVPLTVALVCLCVATGSTLCYVLSAAFGPALLTVPKWRTRIEAFGDKVDGQRANLLSYLVILRISPIPHWMVSLISPHVRIGIALFWVSTLLGSAPLAVIHATIGGGLEQMTSAEDFHLLSWKNLALLSVVVVAALVPVVLRRRNGGGEADAEGAKRTGRGAADEEAASVESV